MTNVDGLTRRWSDTYVLKQKMTNMFDTLATERVNVGGRLNHPEHVCGTDTTLDYVRDKRCHITKRLGTEGDAEECSAKQIQRRIWDISFAVLILNKVKI